VEPSLSVYKLVLFNISNNTANKESFIFDTLEKANEYARNYTMKTLNFLVVIFRLYEEKERTRFKWCQEFNEIFIYKPDEKRLSLINPNYPINKLFKLTQYEFLDDVVSGRIYKITPKFNN
jgi:hypothetical protein